MNKPTTLGINHIGLTVRNLAETVEFFVQTLNFKKVGEFPSYPAAFVSDGTSTLTLWQAETGGDAVPFNRKTNIGLHHLALSVTPEVLDRLGVELDALPNCEVEFLPELSHGGPSRHMMIAVPGSGIRLELRAES